MADASVEQNADGGPDSGSSAEHQWEEFRNQLTVFVRSLSPKEQEQLPEVIARYRETLQLDPTYCEAHVDLMRRLQLLCDWSGLEELWNQTRQMIGIQPIPPFRVLTMPSSPAEQLAAARTWVESRLSPADSRRADPVVSFPHRLKPKLCIGYLSAYFDYHPAAYLSTISTRLAELFELHDRDRFEIYAYAIGPDSSTPIWPRMLDACDHLADLRMHSHAEAAQQIYGDGIDILVDLMGHDRRGRPEIMALCPAPIQVNYLGYPGTMGADFYDYILTDRFITPPEHQRFYTEAFAYLPDCYQIVDRRRPISKRTPTRTEAGLPEEGFVFCCFHAPYKVTPAIFEIWMRLVRQTSGSVLWLVQANPRTTANLRREAEARGVAAERLIFAPELPLSEYLARYQLADLFLDTLPYNAHTTASDVLWAGVPLVTCVGETFPSRVAGSLLTALEMPELITTSLDEYEQLALHLAHHHRELAALREELASKRDTTPLFNSARFTRNLEVIYEKMWNTFLISGSE